MKRFVVDTHALIWYFEANSKQLSKRCLEILNSEDVDLLLPVIVVAEILYYLKKKKSAHHFQAILTGLSEDSRFRLIDLQSHHLALIPPELEMHDGIIAATALDENADGILTKDSELKLWGKCPAIW